MSNDMRFLIECVSKDVTLMLMEDYGWDIRTAVNAFMSSHTYEKLENSNTGLYFQSPVYIHDMLTEELQNGGNKVPREVKSTKPSGIK